MRILSNFHHCHHHPKFTAERRFLDHKSCLKGDHFRRIAWKKRHLPWNFSKQIIIYCDHFRRIPPKKRQFPWSYPKQIIICCDNLTERACILWSISTKLYASKKNRPVLCEQFEGMNIASMLRGRMHSTLGTFSRGLGPTGSGQGHFRSIFYTVWHCPGRSFVLWISRDRTAPSWERGSVIFSVAWWLDLECDLSK